MVFLILALAAILFSGAKQFSNFGRGSPKEHICEIILKSGHWLMRRCSLKKLLMDDRQISITKAHLEHFVLRRTRNTHLLIFVLMLRIKFQVPSSSCSLVYNLQKA